MLERVDVLTVDENGEILHRAHLAGQQRQEQDSLPGVDVPAPEPMAYEVSLTITWKGRVYRPNPEDAIRQFLDLHGRGETVVAKRSLTAVVKA